MTRSLTLKILLVLLPGIVIPLVTGIIHYSWYGKPEIIAANLYFIIISFLVWWGCTFIHRRIRSAPRLEAKPFLRIMIVSFAATAYGALGAGLSAWLWLKISRENFDSALVYRFTLFSILPVIIFTLVYEILFLSRERDRNTLIVDQLDRERLQAELQALHNEMDPHFIFNSLTTLNHLIHDKPEQAQLFNSKLAQAYRYLLINKKREVVPLEDELDFINNYFFLLQISHDNKLQLEIDLNERQRAVMIPPCALQLLVENAIKHNQFSGAHPLQVKIIGNGQYLYVSNNVKPKLYPLNSMGIGLKNLSARYRIICHKDIVIEKTREKFTVKLPLIKNS